MTRNDAPMLMLMLLLSQLAIVDLYHYPVENEMKILGLVRMECGNVECVKPVPCYMMR